MDILLGSLANTNSVNVDNQIRIEFKNTQMLYGEDTLYNIIDETLQFQTERDNCTNYLVYGKVESFIDEALAFNNYQLNTDNYIIELGYISHFEPDISSLVSFTLITGNTINVNTTANLVQADIVLVYQNSENFLYSQILDISGTTVVLDLDPTIDISGYNIVPAQSLYKRHFTVLESTNYIKYYPSSFSKNIFNDQINQFHTYQNVNISGITNNLGLPLTELILRFTLKSENFSSFLAASGTTLSDLTIMDYVIYDLNAMEITVVDSANYLFNDNLVDYYYDPYSIQPIRVFSNTVINASITTLFTYPSYAIIFYSGDIIYKNYLEVGVFESDGNGIDYPFINNINYIYGDNKFIIRRVIPIADYSTAAVIDTTTTDYNNTATNSIPSGGQRLC